MQAHTDSVQVPNDLTSAWDFAGQWDPDSYSPRQEEIFGKSALDHLALADEQDATLEDAHANRLKLLLLGSKNVKEAAAQRIGVTGSAEGKRTKFSKRDMLGVVADQSSVSASQGKVVTSCKTDLSLG